MHLLFRWDVSLSSDFAGNWSISERNAEIRTAEGRTCVAITALARIREDVRSEGTTEDADIAERMAGVEISRSILAEVRKNVILTRREDGKDLTEDVADDAGPLQSHVGVKGNDYLKSDAQGKNSNREIGARNSETASSKTKEKVALADCAQCSVQDKSKAEKTAFLKQKDNIEAEETAASLNGNDKINEAAAVLLPWLVQIAPKQMHGGKIWDALQHAPEEIIQSHDMRSAAMKRGGVFERLLRARDSSESIACLCKGLDIWDTARVLFYRMQCKFRGL